MIMIIIIVLSDISTVSHLVLLLTSPLASCPKEMKNIKLSIPGCVNCQNKNSLFCSLTNSEKTTLETNKGASFIKKGQVIFYEGNYPHGFYCVFKGAIKVSKLGEGGKEQIVRFATSGELLGYRSVLNGEAYMATATAMEDSYVCHLSRDNFMEVMDGDNSLYLELIKLLSNDLKNSEKKLISISQKSVLERIAETLVLLYDKFGLDSDGYIRLSLTRKEIGDIAGIATETTIRSLSELSKKGVVELQGKKILIKNIKKLKSLSN